MAAKTAWMCVCVCFCTGFGMKKRRDKDGGHGDCEVYGERHVWDLCGGFGKSYLWK